MFILIYFYIFQLLLYQSFKVPSSSMEPTIKIGDYIISKNYFRLIKKIFLKLPIRGDIVIFTPYKNNIHYVKRLIGIPGDFIQIKKNILYINKNKIDKRLISLIFKSGRLYNIHIETSLDGYSYGICVFLLTYNVFPNSTPVYRIPSDYLFFLGDNRNNSIDSRFLPDIGIIKIHSILGKGYSVIWSSNLNINIFFILSKINRLFSVLI